MYMSVYENTYLSYTNEEIIRKKIKVENISVGIINIRVYFFVETSSFGVT